MKALILAGGKGTRLRPLTHTGAKQLVPVANKPILWYGIESLVAAGITDIGMIVSPETGLEVQSCTGNGERFGANIQYILQEKPLGLAHAVKVARSFLKNTPFVMYLGDNLIGDDLTRYTIRFKEDSMDALILLRLVPDPRAFGVAEVGLDGRVLGLIEKPLHPPSNLALVGVYLFSPAIHDVIETLKPSARGEFEITDAIQALIDEKKIVNSEHLQSWWLDTGKKDDLLEANRVILDTQILSGRWGEIDEKSRVDGRVQVGFGTKIINSTIRGPVIIGENCYLENTYLGPYSSIADQVILIDADLDHSVVLKGARIEGINYRITDSLVGQRANLITLPKRPKALRFMLGDDSQVELF